MMIRIEVKHMQRDTNLSEIEMLKKAEEQGTPFAIGDENLASPSEIESTETVVLPEIQSMTAYIRYNYEKEILAELDRRIRCGKLGVMCEGRLFRDGNRSLYRKTSAVPLSGLSGRRMWPASVYRFRAHCSKGE